MSRVASATCWAPGPAVEVEELVDLRLAPALGGLVDRELDAARAVGDDLRHQRRVLGRDRLVGEVQHLGHAEDALVEGDPLLHRAELDVADDVVDREQVLAGPGDRRHAIGATRLVAGQEGAAMVAVLDERVDRVAVGRDRREADDAAGIAQLVRRDEALGAGLDRVLPGVLDVRDAERDVTDAVAVAAMVFGDRGVGGRARRSGRSARVPARRTCETRSRTPVSRPA